MRVLSQAFAQMGDHDSRCVDHRITCHFASATKRFRDPRCGQIECRVTRRFALQFHLCVARVDRQVMIHDQLPASNFATADKESIFIYIDLQVVANPCFGNPKTVILRYVFAQTGDAICDSLSFSRIDQRNQSRANLHNDSFGLQKLVQPSLLGTGRLLLCFLFRVALLFLFVGVAFGSYNENQHPDADHDKRDFGKPWCERNEKQYRGSDEKGSISIFDLLPDLFAQT